MSQIERQKLINKAYEAATNLRMKELLKGKPRLIRYRADTLEQMIQEEKSGEHSRWPGADIIEYLSNPLLDNNGQVYRN